jgi:hypothetical protein
MTGTNRASINGRTDFPKEGRHDEESFVTSDAAGDEPLVTLAVESWRFSRVFARLAGRLDAGEAARYASQLRYFQQKIEDSLQAAALRLVDLEGQEFDPGMAVAPLNLGDFHPDDLLLVDQMIEPIIMSREGLRRQGTVMLRKLHK